MIIFRTIVNGLQRAVSATKLLLLLWLVNFASALPFALLTTSALAEDIGASQFGENLRHGFDTEWLAEYDVRARGIATLFSPLRTGAGVVYDNLDAWLSGDLFRGHPSLLALGAGYGLLWILLQGAILARLAAPQERFTLARFFAAGGRYFGRLAQLAGFSLLVYYALYRLAAQIFGHLDDAFRDRGTETEFLTRSLVVGAFFILLLHLVRMIFDYAKIETVVHNTRWSPVAAWHGARFVWARPVRTVGIYTGFGLLSLAFLGLYTQVAPGAGNATTMTVAVGFLFSQLFVVGRLLLRVATLDAEMSTFRSTGGQ